MKILSFEKDGRASYGIADDGGIRAVDDAFAARFPDVKSLLAGGALADLPRNVAGKALDPDSIRFLPPVPNPDKILCVGVNYRPHAEEMGRELPEHPLIFVRFAASQCGHGGRLIKPAESEQYDYEGELAAVIGRTVRRVDPAEALDVIAGYSCFMDGSVRDWQRHTTQFTAGKNFAQSGAMGPYLVTPDELPPVERLTLETRVNGEVMQRGCLDELIFPLPELIAYCSTFAELRPGDVIVTGTPSGVGAGRRPPIWLGDGDLVEVDIGPVGMLAAVVSAE